MVGSFFLSTVNGTKSYQLLVEATTLRCSGELYSETVSDQPVNSVFRRIQWDVSLRNFRS